MTDEELKDIIQKEYIRRLARYRMMDDFYRKKYCMDFDTFEEKNMVEQLNYTFEVESDAQEWELAIDGIKTVEKKLKDLLDEN